MIGGQFDPLFLYVLPINIAATMFFNLRVFQNVFFNKKVNYEINMFHFCLNARHQWV